jgi:Family of unknown function (DUF5675)
MCKHQIICDGNTSIFGLLLAALFFLSSTTAGDSQEICSKPEKNDFIIGLYRSGRDQVTERKDGRLVERTFGVVSVNGRTIGRFYENPKVAMREGTYKGLMRYQSSHNFVLGACGVMATDGDFLLEVSGVVDDHGKLRTNLLFHPGERPSNSDGCVLFGARIQDGSGNWKTLDSSNPLFVLRQLFYGTDDPVNCPNKSIVVIIKGRP